MRGSAAKEPYASPDTGDRVWCAKPRPADVALPPREDRRRFTPSCFSGARLLPDRQARLTDRDALDY